MDPVAVRREFEERGMVRLDGALADAEVTAIRDAVWRFAGRRTGIVRDDPSTWPERLQLSWKSLRRNPVFDALLRSEAVVATLDAVFGGADEWARPKPGAQVLLTLPQPPGTPWVLPSGWHMDCGFERPTWPVFAVKLFAFFGPVEPCGGGTMLLPGSHRLVERFQQELPPGTGGGMVNWHRLLRRDPRLTRLLQGEREDDGGRSLVGQRHEVDGVPVEVVELTGQPGDVVVTHLHLYHSASPNTSDRPRQMLGKAVHRRGEDQPVDEGTEPAEKAG